MPDFVPSDHAQARALASFASLVAAVERWGADQPTAAAYHLYATVHGYVMLELVGVGPADRRRLDEIYEAGLRRVLDGIVR